MAELTLADLRRILRESAGDDEAAAPDGDGLDVPFTELGYDSLVVLDAIGRIGAEYGLAIPDDAVGGLTTPRLLLDYVNGRRELV